jgi:hypothetical protein
MGGMFYPVNTQGMIRHHLTGAFAGDPTLPYRPSLTQRLSAALHRSAATRSQTTRCSQARTAAATD